MTVDGEARSCLIFVGIRAPRSNDHSDPELLGRLKMFSARPRKFFLSQPLFFGRLHMMTALIRVITPIGKSVKAASTATKRVGARAIILVGSKITNYIVR
jgi:hypothetical protein